MLWKLLGLQNLLDALFDEAWCRLCLPETEGGFHEERLGTSED
jgi:hypothetical protein